MSDHRKINILCENVPLIKKHYLKYKGGGGDVELANRGSYYIPVSTSKSQEER